MDHAHLSPPIRGAGAVKITHDGAITLRCSPGLAYSISPCSSICHSQHLLSNHKQASKSLAYMLFMQYLLIAIEKLPGDGKSFFCVVNTGESLQRLFGALERAPVIQNNLEFPGVASTKELSPPSPVLFFCAVAQKASSESNYFARSCAVFYKELGAYQQLVKDTDAIDWSQEFLLQGKTWVSGPKAQCVCMCQCY